jgi:hypothetical protein
LQVSQSIASALIPNPLQDGVDRRLGELATG